MFSKRLTEIDVSDLQALIDRKAQEGPELEFKGTLSTKDGTPDVWFVDQKKLGNLAKRDISKELIAFANTYGGTLILGLAEDGEKRASTLELIPQCRALADRLGASIIASCDPPLSSLEAVGVELKGDAGVVVFRVTASHRAPHRDRDERECYHRVGDASVPMDMRQIQDLSVNVRWRLDRIAVQLDKMSAEFQFAQPSGAYVKGSDNTVYPMGLSGVRAAAVPIQKVYFRELSTQKLAHLVRPQLTALDGPNGQARALRGAEFPNWRPMLRGMRLQSSENTYGKTSETVTADGVIQIVSLLTPVIMENYRPPIIGVPIQEVISVFADLLIRVQALKDYFGRNDLDYALDFEWVFPAASSALIPSTDGFGGLQVRQAIKEHNRVTDYEMPDLAGLPRLWDELQADLMQSFELRNWKHLPIDFGAAVSQSVASLPQR